MLLIGKPSISMGHLYHGYVSHNQSNHTILVRFYHLPSFWDAVAGEVGFPAWHDTAQHLFEGSDG